MANFVLNHYNWSEYSTMVLHFTIKWYIATQAQGSTIINDDDSFSRLPTVNLSNYTSFVYSTGFQMNLDSKNISSDDAYSTMNSQFNVVYDSGSYYLAMKPNNK